MQELITAYFPLIRLGLFACSVAWCLGGLCVLRPRRREVHAAIMAAWVQFSVGTAADIAAVQLGWWSYRPMDLQLGAVPLDLHLDWAMVWGFLMPWLYSKWRLQRHSAAAIPYLLAWTAATV